MPADKAPPYNLANLKLLVPGRPPIPLHMAKSHHFYKALTSKIPIPDRTRWNNYPNIAPHIPKTVPINPLPMLPNKIDDLRLQVYHKAVPCGYTTSKQPPHCQLCQTLQPGHTEPIRETIHHRFIECPTAQTTWKWGEQLLNKPILDAHKLFGNPIRTNPLTQKTNYADAIENAILGILQWCIWTHRNHFIFQQANPSPFTAIHQAKAFLHYFTSSLHFMLTQLKNPNSALYNPAKYYQLIDALTHFPKMFTITTTGFTADFTGQPAAPRTRHPGRPPDTTTQGWGGSIPLLFGVLDPERQMP
jgi:hypothetical protein